MTEAPSRPSLLRNAACRTIAGIMQIAPCALICALVVPLISSLQADAAWDVPGTPVRYRIEREDDPVPGAETGAFTLCLNGAAATGTCRVFSAAGKAVGHELLWRAEGQPYRVLFDCSENEQTYYVYPAPDSASLATTWKATPGLVLETRVRADGEPDSAERIMSIYDACAPTLGRSCVDRVFVGIHPHGPNTSLAASFRGVFTVPRAGTYGFATVSDDASCILVDGEVVAQWPGWHGPLDGLRGAFGGEVELKAGRHDFTYYNIQKDGGFCVVTGWKPPGQAGYSVMPADAFLPVARFRVAGCEAASREPVQPRFTWRMTGHARVDKMSLITVVFTCLNAEGNYAARWLFDDGTEQRGTTVTHVFCRDGMRRVRLSVHTGERELGHVEHTVRIHPRWKQREAWSGSVFGKQRAWLLGLELARLSVDDLAELYRIAARIEDRELRNKSGFACLQRKEHFGPAHADVFYDLALHMQHHSLKRLDLADEAFGWCDAIATNNPPLRAAGRMHRAGMYIHCLQKIEKGQVLLESIDSSVMDPSDQRLKTIFEADALLALGHVGAARALYLSVGTVVDRGDMHFAIRRRGRLQTARDYLSRGEYDAAESIIRAIEWETPLERLNTETGLLMIRVHMSRKHYRMAYSHCHRLIYVSTTDARRPRILLALGRVCLATGRKGEAGEVFRMLSDQHPYSEAAALARDAWPAPFQ